MKQYPSIPHVASYHGLFCSAFHKYDGSNLRFSWTKKRGWHKFGTRTQLFSDSEPTFGSAIKIFNETYADGLAKVFIDNKLFRNTQEIIVFGEFFGAKSFAGQHLPDDPKQLVLFDVNIHKKGFLGPDDFVDTFGHLKTAELVYRGALTKDFEREVREGVIPGLNEGVICKGGSTGSHKMWMCKIKTNAYKELLRQRFLDSWDKYWE